MRTPNIQEKSIPIPLIQNRRRASRTQSAICLLLLMEMSLTTVLSEVRYYGYYHTATAYRNGLQEVGAFTTLNHIFGTPANLQLCRQTKTLALVDTRWQFFLERSGTNYLRPDWQTHWNILANDIRPSIDWVGAFYVMDEPFWNGVTFDELTFAVARIKETFPRVPVMTTFAAPSVNENLRVPSKLDWLGFDRYGNFSTIPPLLQQLKSKLAAHQRVFLVPDGVLQGDTDSQVAAWNYVYFALGESDPVVIGLLVFHWTTARTLPLTFAAQKDIGSNIVRRAKCTVTVLSEPELAGTVTGGGIYVVGMRPSISATPKPYFLFSGWVGDAVANPAASSTRITNLSTNVVLRATFTPADSDRDGLPDGWMVMYFKHTNGLASDNSRPQDDADGDGAVNSQEYQAGTNPTNSLSVLKLVLVPDLAQPAHTLFHFTAVSNKTYSVEYQSNLGTPGWATLTSYNAVPTNWEVWVTNREPSNQTKGFYRVRTPRK